MLIVILLFCCFQTLFASIADRELKDTFVWLLGDCARGKPVSEINSQPFFEHARKEAEKILANNVDVEYAEIKLSEYAKWFLHTYSTYLRNSWCKKLSDIHDFVKPKLPHAKPNELAFVYIAMYLALGDSIWTSRDNSLFLQPVAPQDISFKFKGILERYIKEGYDYLFILSEDPRSSYLLELLARSQGKKVINLAINCWHRPQDFLSQRGYKGLLSGLSYAVCSATSNMHAILDAHHEGLWEIMMKKMWQVMGESWEKYGMQNLIAAHHIFCERRLKMFFSLEEDCMMHWFPRFFLCRKIHVSVHCLKCMMSRFVPGSPGVATLRGWEVRFWKKLFTDLPEVNTRSRQKSVFCDVYRSWFPEEQPTYGKESFRRMAIAAIEVICAQAGDIADEEREILLSFAQRDFTYEGEFFFFEQKMVGFFTSSLIQRVTRTTKSIMPSYTKDQEECDALQAVIIPSLSMPKKDMLEVCSTQDKKLYLESIFRSLAFLMNKNRLFMNDFPIVPGYIQRMISFFTSEDMELGNDMQYEDRPLDQQETFIMGGEELAILQPAMGYAPVPMMSYVPMPTMDGPSGMYASSACTFGQVQTCVHSCASSGVTYYYYK